MSLASLAWGISALLLQAVNEIFLHYPSNYGFNISSAIWFAWSAPLLVLIIFGPWTAVMFFLDKVKSPMFRENR